MRLSGFFIVIIALTVPFIWFAQVSAGHSTLASISQFLGALSLICMALTQFIATRWRVVELLFGGLDRSYIFHKWLGISATLFFLLHDMIGARMRELGRPTLVQDFASTLGSFSYYSLLGLVAVTLLMFVPYHLWRWSHRLMGAFFLIAAAHFLLVLKPFQNTDPLGLYILGFIALGALSYVWRLLPARIRLSRLYRVAHVQPTGQATAITFEPVAKPLRHRAGQFAFVSFDGQEAHPFTLSSAPRADGTVRMSIGKLGDYTKALSHNVKVGMPVRFEGPFGHFERRRSGKPQLWIAGGIGITPFLAWAEDLAPKDAPVHLVYSVRSQDAAAHLDQLQALATAKPNLTLYVHDASLHGFATADSLLRVTGLKPKGLIVSFCGPKPMRESLRKDFRTMGVARWNFRYEEFEIRTGIGLDALIQHFLSRTKLGIRLQESLSSIDWEALLGERIVALARSKMR